MTLLWLASALIVHIPFGLLLSLMLNRRPHGWKFLRVMYFIPNVISTTAVAFMWYFIYHADMGLLNAILRAVGLGSLARSWLGNTQTALICNQIPFMLYVGLTSIIFLTQLSTIPTELYEAAEIDGAGRWQQMIHVTLPCIAGTIVVVMVLKVGSMMSAGFDQIFNLYNSATMDKLDIIDTYVYRLGIESSKYSYSSAVGLLKNVINLMLVLLTNWFAKRIGQSGLF